MTGTKTRPSRKSIVILLLLLALIAGGIFSAITGGRSDTGITQLWGVIFTPDSSLPQSVLRDIRLPRTFSAALLGVNLGLAGLALQAITRNPLASPAILGINQGAALGLTLSLIIPGLTDLSPDAMAVAGAMAAGVLTFAIAGGLRGKMDSMRLILGGVAVGAFAYAIVRFSFTLDDELARSVVRWTVGDIGYIRWPQTRWLAIWALAGLLCSFVLAQRFNLMALGQASAQGLGSDPRITLLLGTILAAALAGISVSVAGPIAFVGLVVPHIARIGFGADHRILVPATALTGAALMLLADGLSKWLSAPVETPIGVIAALIGAPWFLWLTLSTKESR